MYLFTNKELRDIFFKTIKEPYGTNSINYLLQLSKSFDPTEEYDIFISHKYTDVPEIIGFIEILKELNYTLCIDWVEKPNTDRNNVTYETANLLRQFMQASNSLVYINSSHAEHSIWMQWELGYYDGKKQKAAVLNISSYDNTAEPYYSKREFLKLYPYILKSSEEDIYLRLINGKSIPFREWLSL